MKIITGCIIMRDNKILMVKEAKKKCYGQWNYPAGHLDDFEKITDGAIRETFEETGYRVKLTGVLPIATVFTKDGTRIMIKFMAEIVEGNISFNQEEILDVKWIDIDEIKNMKKEELRGYDSIVETINNVENNNIYPLELFDDRIYN